MTKNTVLCTFISLLPLACVEDDESTQAAEALAEAPDPPEGTEAIRASEDVTRATGVVRYVVYTDEHVQRIVAFDADGNVAGESAAELRADGGLVLTYETENDVVTIEHDEPTLDEHGNTVYRMAIDGQAVVMRETADGPAIEGELSIANPEVLERWRVWDQDLVEHVAQWRTWSCTACMIQAAACATLSGVCVGACATIAACTACAASLTTCLNSFFNNCVGACASDGGGGGGGGGGGSGGPWGGGQCNSSFECPDPWQVCIGGLCS
jgi:hypothetical protein